MVLFFLFNDSIWLRIPQFVLFCCIAWLSGKKRNPLVSVLCMAGIVFFNLLAPYGKVLCEWGPLRITQGSLLAGAEKALTLEGLLLLSGACVRPGLRLPGAFGVLLGESFRILGLMTGRRILFRRGRVIEGLDRLMTELEHAPPGGASSGTGAPEERPARNVKGLLLLAGMTALTAALGIAGGR
jgi:heptaprenyl diphosphate synthase